MLLCIDYYLFYPTKFILFPNQYQQTLVKIHSIRYQNSDKIILCHIQMLQCSCNDISDCEVRLRKSCLQLEKIVTLELESTDLEYCSRYGVTVNFGWKVNHRISLIRSDLKKNPEGMGAGASSSPPRTESLSPVREAPQILLHVHALVWRFIPLRGCFLIPPCRTWLR